MDDRIIAGRVTITKYLDENYENGVGVEVDYSDDLPLIEAMGLLTFATLNVQDDYEVMDLSDEHDDN